MFLPPLWFNRSKYKIVSVNGVNEVCGVIDENDTTDAD